MPTFNRALKRLLKKYPSLKTDLASLDKDLRNNPDLGVDLGNNVSKIRLAITSKGRGKSGGARVIAHHEIIAEISEHTIRLLSIFDKSEQPTIKDSDIIALLRKNGLID